MLLLHTLIESDFNNIDALTELNLDEVIKILSKRRLFFSLGDMKSNLSEKVL